MLMYAASARVDTLVSFACVVGWLVTDKRYASRFACTPSYRTMRSVGVSQYFAMVTDHVTVS